MKIITMIFSCLLLASCGQFERDIATYTGGGYETCHDGVAYIQFTSGASVKYNKDGRIATCE